MSYQTASDTVLDMMGDATRRQILELIRETPRAVGEIAALLPVSRPAVSKHLRLMREAGLVDVDVQGTRRIYRIRPQGFAAIVSYWDGFWSAALNEFKSYAERGA